MKAGEFAVSIQWGAGYHYFIWTGDNGQAAIKIALSHKKALEQRKQKRGAKPEVFAWGKIPLV